MPTLLHIDSSPLYGISISREMSATFVDQWKGLNPDGTILERDLAATQIPPIDAKWVGAAFTPEEVRTPEQKQILALSDSLIAELFQATEYIIGVPMHNFGVPSAFKLWIDQIVRLGKTFVYGDGKPIGLLHDKKATFVIATGSIYDVHTQMESFNFVEPYLRAVFAFGGVSDTAFLTAGGTGALRHGQDRTTFLAPHLQAVQAHVQRFAGGRA